MGVASRETRHVQEMVARQNNKKVGGKRAGGGGGGGYGGGGRSGRMRSMRSGYDWCGGGGDDYDPYGDFDTFGGRSSVPEPVVSVSRNVAARTDWKPVNGQAIAATVRPVAASVRPVTASVRPVMARPADVAAPTVVKAPLTAGGREVWGARVRDLLAGRNYGLFVAQVMD